MRQRRAAGAEPGSLGSRGWRPGAAPVLLLRLLRLLLLLALTAPLCVVAETKVAALSDTAATLNAWLKDVASRTTTATRHTLDLTALPSDGLRLTAPLELASINVEVLGQSLGTLVRPVLVNPPASAFIISGPSNVSLSRLDIEDFADHAVPRRSPRAPAGCWTFTRRWSWLSARCPTTGRPAWAAAARCTSSRRC